MFLGTKSSFGERGRVEKIQQRLLLESSSNQDLVFRDWRGVCYDPPGVHWVGGLGAGRPSLAHTRWTSRGRAAHACSRATVQRGLCGAVLPVMSVLPLRRSEY